MQVTYGALCLPDLLSHAVSAHFTKHIQSVLITRFKSLPELSGVKGFIAAYGRKTLALASNQDPHRPMQFSHTQLRVGLERGRSIGLQTAK